MKKLFVLVLALTSAGILNNVSAQCTPPAPAGNPGLSPNWEQLACAEQGVAYSATINVENFDTVGGIVIQSLKIDSLTNIPSGLTYTPNPSNATFAGGATGCIAVSGTTSVPAQCYKLGIYVTVTLSGLGPISGEASELVEELISLGVIDTTTTEVPNFDYYLQVIEAGGVCDSNTCLSARVNDLSGSFTGLSATPNPFTAQTVINWTSNVDGQFTAKLFDVTGKEVFNQQLQVRNGNNSLTVERAELAAGSYMFILTDGRKSISTKLMVRE